MYRFSGKCKRLDGGAALEWGLVLNYAAFNEDDVYVGFELDLV